MRLFKSIWDSAVWHLKEKNNPLINEPDTKFGMPAWDKIEPKHIEYAIDWAVKQAQKNYDAIRAVPLENANFENIIEAIEFAEQDLERVFGVLDYYYSNANSDDIKKIHNDAVKKLTAFSTPIMSDPDIFARVESVYNNKAGLDDVQSRLTDLIYRDFAEGPVSLSEQDREIYVELKNRLTDLSSKFKENIENHMDPTHKDGLKYVVKKDEISSKLPGVGQDLIDIFLDKDTGDVVISALPESIDVLEVCTNRETRKAIYNNWTGRGNVGAGNNDAIASEIHQIKQKLAKLFGYENLVEKTITPENRAAQNSENVWSILHRMRDIGYRSSHDIHQQIMAEARKDGLEDVDFQDEAKRIQPWDEAFYRNIVNQKEGSISPEEEKKYFHLPDVEDGLIRSMKDRFGIILEETNDFKMPSEDMKVFYSKTEAGEVKGIFIQDLYQRKGKRGGAWCGQLRAAGNVNGEFQVPITVVNCNYAVDKNSPYINYDSTITLYHEWGHGTDGDTTKQTPYPSINSFVKAWDAVEVPSQFNERFAAMRDHFNSYARNKDNGELMPTELFNKLTEAKPSFQLLRQNQFGWLDMELYSQTDEISCMADFNKAVFDRTQIIPNNDNNYAMVNGFSHIMSGGYSAGYYSYLYADFMVSALEDLYEKYGQQAIDVYKEEFLSVGKLKDTGVAFENISKALGETPEPLSADSYLRKAGYGKYIDAADAEGTSGAGVKFSMEYKRPKLA